MAKKKSINRDYLIDELKVLETVYASLKDGSDYDLEMAEKIKEKIQLIEKELYGTSNGIFNQKIK